MENNIFEPNKDFIFSNISLAQPSSIQGGAYFTKILYNNKPFYIESPKCTTKQGFVKNGKKIFCDLMFDNSNEEFINWIENLETVCQKLIYEKGDSWFQNKLELDDIETAFTSALRIYKSGKYYLMRVNVKMNYNTNIPLVKIYNESEVPLTTEDVNSNTNIISIVEVQGIKFTSRNFQIELEMKQAMVLNTYEMFENCLIKKSNNKNESFQSQNMYNNENPLQDKILIQSKKDTTEQIKPQNDLEESVNNGSISNKSLEQIEEANIAKEVALEIATNLEKKDILNNQESLSNYLENKDDPKEEQQITENNGNAVTEMNELNLEVEELTVEENNSDLKEFDINENIDTLESITLKKPNEYYYQIYKEARKKAKQAKKEAVIAFLEAKNIKKVYMLEDLDESDSEDSDLNNLENYSDESEIEEDEDELIEE
jgi:hypothetical protein